MENLSVAIKIAVLVFLAGLTACASQPKAPKVQLDYGTIEMKELMTGNIKDSTLVGGYLGMMEIPVGPEVSEEDRNRKIMSASATHPDKYRYTVKKLDGTSVKIVTGKDFFARKDCVAIEKGYSYNLRLVDDQFCQATRLEANMLKKQQKPANDCVQAKRQMIIAQSDREVINARQMVEVACQFTRN